MNIVYLASVRIPNEKASGLAIVKQCEAFAELGHSVTLLKSDRKNSIQEDLFSYYSVEHRFAVVPAALIHPNTNFGVIGFLVMRVSLMVSTAFWVFKKRNEIDVLYARDQWMLLLPLFFIPHKKIICEMHTRHTDVVTKYVLKHVGLLITISKGLKDFYLITRRKDDILVEPSGVDIKQFENLPPVVNVRESLHLPPDKVIIGYVGKYTTMGEEKGVGEIIEAFSGVYKKNQDVHLLMVGLEKNEFEIVIQKCNSLHLPENSYSLRTLDPKEFALYLHASDVLVMNYPNTEHYRLYMSPTKLFAYMAAGKVIVSSDLPSIREIVEDSFATFVVPGNVDDLIDKLRIVCGNLRNYEMFGVYAQARVKLYSWENRSSRILEKVYKFFI